MSDIPETPQDSCVLVHVDLSSIGDASQRASVRDVDLMLAEAIGLAEAIEIEVLGTHTIKPKQIHAGAFFGSGQRSDIAAIIEDLSPDILIVNGTLSPVQQRNLEQEWQIKVIDRTGLILEIFGARAQTKEGQLQVEIAQLDYQRSRLVNSWTHLERQRGGAGTVGGPGETQIELDRRMNSDRMVKLKKELEVVKRTRELGRKSRERVPFPVIALVGYTNAGKSTLFNYVTGADVMAEDLLFATLDPTMRRVEMPKGQKTIFSDTVGFISNLPTDLIAAFRSTLEQVAYADVIVHVMDIAQDGYKEQRKDVISILADLGVEYDTDERIIEAWNKIDLLDDDARDEMERAALHDDAAVTLSAVNGSGIDDLLLAVEDVLQRDHQINVFEIPVSDGKAQAWLYSHAHVTERTDSDSIVTMSVNIDKALRGQFLQQFGYGEPVEPESEDPWPSSIPRE